MRFEGKNGYFANKKYKNFKNLPLSLSRRHQLYMAYIQSGSQNGRSESYLYAGDRVTAGVQVGSDDAFPDLATTTSYTELSHSIVYTASSVTIHGLEYRAGCALVLDYCEGEPVIGLLESIVLLDHVKYFIVQRLKTAFDLHILSHVVESNNARLCVSYFDLKFKWPLSVYEFSGSGSTD